MAPCRLEFRLNVLAVHSYNPKSNVHRSSFSPAFREAGIVQAIEVRREREAQIAKAQMDAARASGISWGMAEDAPEEDIDMGTASGADAIDWQTYSASHGLTEKQQKLAAKVQKLRNRIANLQREMDRIKVGTGEVPGQSLSESVQSVR